MLQSTRARFFYVSLSILLISSCKTVFWDKKPSQDKSMRLAPEINFAKLNNGLGYYFMKSTKPAGRCYVRLHVDIGSFAESDKESGIAHLLEHMAFDDRALSQDISLVEWFQKHGMSFGADANAYTSAQSTVYKIDLPSCEPKAVQDALAILRSFSDKLIFKDETLIKEKTIIDREELESKNISSQISDKIISHLYSGTLYPKRPVLGKAATRNLINKDMLMSFYHKYYQPKNLSVVLVGDYKDLDVASLIKQNFEDLAPRSAYIRPPMAGKLDHKTPVFIIHEKNLAQVQIIFSIQAKEIKPPRFSVSLLKERIAFDMAIYMLKNAFAEQARAQAMVNENTINGFMYDKNIYELSLTSTSSLEHYDQNFLDAYAILRQAAETGFEKRAFSSTKALYLDYLAQATVSEATWGSNNWTDLILEHINGQGVAYSALDYQKWAEPIINSLNAKDCQEALKKALKSGYEFILSIGLLDNTPENITKLKKLLEKAQSQKIAETLDSEKVNFAYKIPNCSVIHVAPRKYMSNIESYSVKVSDNLNILVKKTKFKDDEVLLDLFTNEGFMTMSPQDLARARLMQANLSDRGLGKHAPENLVSLLKDKFFSMRVNILAHRIEAIINTRNEDLRFALELLRANISDPLYDKKSLDRTKEKLKINYEELKHNMWAPLQDHFPRFLSNFDYRVGQEKLEDLLAISHEDLALWHKKYLDKQALNLVVVGDVDLDQILNDITCVFGPLAEQAKPHVPKKVQALSFKSGLSQEYEVDTSDNASKIVLRYPLMFPKDSLWEHELGLIQNIIQEQLRLKLREKRHAAYSPSAIVVMSKYPGVQNWIDIVLSVPKAEAQAILQETKKILDNLAKKGINNNELLKAKEPYRAQKNNLFNTNNYWLFALAQDFLSADKMPSEKQIMSQIKLVNIGKINKILSTYLRSSKASSAIVHSKQSLDSEGINLGS